MTAEPEHKCMTQSCENEPATLVFWPGKEPKPACLPCAVRAQTIADAMGFHCPVLPLAHNNGEGG